MMGDIGPTVIIGEKGKVFLFDLNSLSQKLLQLSYTSIKKKQKQIMPFYFLLSCFTQQISNSSKFNIMSKQIY